MHLPPALASILTIGFIVFLFRRDIREKPDITAALWLPVFWMLLIGSRFVSQWLSLLGVSMGAVSLEEGSPLDALVFFVLIAGGLYILNQRQASLGSLVRSNAWITFFLLYCFVSIAWSDFPFVAFKRWIKVLGHPIMALVLLSEPDPEEAVTRLVKRCAYVLVPVSILFIKYYPALGRGFNAWGESTNTGVTTNKNELGYVCLVLGFFFVWHVLKTLRAGPGTARRGDLILSAGFLIMIAWLLKSAHSSTSLVSLLVGVLVVIFLGSPFVNKRFIGTYLVVGVLALLSAELVFGIYAHTIELLGKDPTLTDRTLVWRELLNVQVNPILGAGFESFWLGPRLEKLWDIYWWHPNQAHNGYLETYLDLGLAGLLLLMGLFITTFWKSRLELLKSFELGRFRLGFLAAVVVYNWTEASFKALHLVWFVFYIVAIDYPKFRFEPVKDLPREAFEEEPGELVCERV